MNGILKIIDSNSCVVETFNFDFSNLTDYSIWLLGLTDEYPVSDYVYRFN